MAISITFVGEEVGEMNEEITGDEFLRSKFMQWIELPLKIPKQKNKKIKK